MESDHTPLTAKWYLHECCVCHDHQERVYTDSWTGSQVCSVCLLPVLKDITRRPSRGDNFRDLFHLHEMDDTWTDHYKEG